MTDFPFCRQQNQRKLCLSIKQHLTVLRKPKGAKGIQLTATTQGISAYKTIKGKKNTFTAKFNWDAPVSLKGRTASFKVKTYNNTKYKAYSYDSKPKKLKIK